MTTPSTLPTETLRDLVAVIRVSQRAGREGPRFLSPGDQRNVIETWAAAHGCRVVKWFDETDSVSGRTVDRVGLNGAMAMIDRDQADGLIVAKIDRFARTVVGGLTAVAKLAGGEDEHGRPKNPKRFVAAAEGIDSVGKMDARAQLMFTIFLAIAQWQWEVLREGWETTHDVHVARGVGVGRPSYGYRKGPDGVLVVHEPEAEVVRKVFTARAAGESWPAIAKRLDVEHPKPDGDAWVPSHLQRMATKRTYLGEIAVGGRTNPNAHEAIVTPAQFRAVRDMKATGRKQSDVEYLLSGVARCASCGGRMGGAVRPMNGQVYFYYRCRRRYGWGVCPKPQMISVPKLNALVLDRVFALAAEAPKAVVSDADFTKAEMALSKAEDRLRYFATSPEVDRTREELGDSWFEEGMKARREAVQEARDNLAQARSDLMGVYMPTDLRSDWPNLTFSQQRAIVAAVIPLVAVRPGRRQDISGRVRIWTYLDADVPASLPGQDGVRAITPLKF